MKSLKFLVALLAMAGLVFGAPLARAADEPAAKPEKKAKKHHKHHRHHRHHKKAEKKGE